MIKGSYLEYMKNSENSGIRKANSPIRKWSKDTKHFTEYIHYMNMANKHMKKMVDITSHQGNTNLDYIEKSLHTY